MYAMDRMPSKRALQVLAYVAANVQRLRVKRGLTQQQVTDMIDLDLRHYRRIERGTENITMETLVALADVLGVVATVLMRRARPLPVQTGRPARRSRPVR